MNKKILLGIIPVMLLATVVTVMAEESKKTPCEDWLAATCLYCPNDGNIHVWYGGDHAICVPMDKFEGNALEGKLADGWYKSSSKLGYICKWSYM